MKTWTCDNCGKEVGVMEVCECQECSMVLCACCYDEHACWATGKEHENKTLLEAFEKTIGPLRKFQGRCYETSCLMVKKKLIQGKPRYGMWLGPVHRTSMFAGKAISRHGWIELPDGRICDPTRWAFEGVDPYIFVGPNDEGYYDMGSNMLREAMMKPCPANDPKDEQHKLPKKATTAKALRTLTKLPSGKKTFSEGQLMWIANLPLNHLGEHAKDTYLWLIKEGREAYIPYDNKTFVLEKK